MAEFLSPLLQQSPPARGLTHATHGCVTMLSDSQVYAKFQKCSYFKSGMVW